LEKKMLDILIIGSGPAGLSAAVYAKRANMDVLVAERMPYGESQIALSSQVDNYLGLPGISGYEMDEKFRAHAETLGVKFQTADAIQFTFSDGRWDVSFSDDSSVGTKTVIYAAGAKHRRLDIKGEQEFAGKGVSYCATCDGAFFKGKTAAVIGGGDTALDDALYLADICSKVYLVHRRNEFRGSANTVEKLRNKENVTFVLEARPKEIIGTDKVQEILMEDGRTISTDAVFVAVGMAPATEAVRDVVATDENGYIVSDETGKTSADGFFAAGDVRTKRLRQVITAVADGANAATEAEHYIRQR
jgi:thioredoxin reductase (NADPH)